MQPSAEGNQKYWNELADEYQSVTRISCEDYHYGPLLPGDAELQLLPTERTGLRCLELGCGAGQNSIYLASCGAECIATDVAEEQLAHGQALAQEAGVKVDFRAIAMEALPSNLGTFDLIHSSFGLPFANDPATLVKRLATEFLNPGGICLFSLAHPVFAGEWLEIDEEGEGMFLRDYFRPPADIRWSPEDDLMVQSRSYPISESLSWFLDSGFTITAVREPEPLPVPAMSKDEIQQRIPYDSPPWRELFDQITHVPVVLIIRAELR